MQYYSLKHILSKQATYNLIIGERSNGKTYAVLEYCLKNFLAGKGQCAILRRWQEDIIGRRASGIWDALNKDGKVAKLSKGKYTNVFYYAGKFFLGNIDENGKRIYNAETDCIGYTFSLSDSEHNKSVSYPNVTTIFFDEFLTKKIYFLDEFVTFMNVVSTIVRQRDNVKIFMCGNTVNKYCPYFKEMGLKHIAKMKQGTIDVYHYGNSKLVVAVEYCKSLGDSKSSNKYFAFDNPRLQMIKTGAWELDIFPHLPKKYKPSNILFTFFIEFEENIFQCEIVDFSNCNIGVYIHTKTTPLKNTDKDLIYSLEDTEKINYCKSIQKPFNRLTQKIFSLFKMNKVFYQNNDVGNTVANFMKAG